jgi:hypothetical protein
MKSDLHQVEHHIQQMIYKIFAEIKANIKRDKDVQNEPNTKQN